MNEKTVQIIQKLTKRTLAREVFWINTSRETEYQLKLPSGRITVDLWSTELGENAEFRIYNEDGVEIEGVRAIELSSEFPIIASLHQAIVKRKLNVDETLTAIERDIEAEGTIGDEIPF